jgi:hypothetical protein
LLVEVVEDLTEVVELELEDIELLLIQKVQVEEVHLKVHLY